MTSLDVVMNDVLDAVIAYGGRIDADPGELLKRLATEVGHDYYAVAAAVRRLELVGFLTVERYDHPESRKANKVVALELNE